MSAYLLSGVARCGYCGGAMVGHVGSAARATGGRKPYRSYHCSNAAKSRGKCGHPNHHKTEDLEAAVLEALSAYADPARVRELLAQDQGRDLERQERELRHIDVSLDKLAKTLKFQMGLLQGGTLDQEQFARMSQEERTDRQRLMERRAALEAEVKAQRERQEMAESLPRRIKGFMDAVQALPVQQAKARLQELLKAVRVTRDTIEIEWR